MKFSIIIPTYQRGYVLGHCLQSLAMLDYPHDEWEVIVVNDSPTPIAKRYLPQQFPASLRVLSNEEGKGPASARNWGAKQSRGNILCFTDDDCRVLPSWLRQFEDAFARLGCDGVGGTWLNPYEDSTVATAAEFYMEFTQRYHQDEQHNARLLLTNNVAYRRETFEALGGFDKTFPLAAAEDLEFSTRLVMMGYVQRIVPEIKVWHDHQSTVRKYFWQQFRYGRGGYYFKRKQDVLSKVIPNFSKGKHIPLAFTRAIHKELHTRPFSWKEWALVLGSPVAYRAGMLYETLKHILE